MNVVLARPPMWAEIDAAFQVADLPVIFAWGDTIYNPRGGIVTPELHAHEAVHGQRQGEDIAAWWKCYIASPSFRLNEEIPAHRAEFRTFKSLHSDRNQVARYLQDVAQRLASPLYGHLLSYNDARREIVK